MLTPGLHAFKLLSILFILFSQGENGKMSASDPNSAIYVTDTAKEIKNKVYSVLYFGNKPCFHTYSLSGWSTPE